MANIISGQHHEITSLSLPSDGSIDVRAVILTPINGEPYGIAASFICPYCWEENIFSADLRNKGIVVICEQVQVEFGVLFK